MGLADIANRKGKHGGRCSPRITVFKTFKFLRPQPYPNINRIVYYQMLCAPGIGNNCDDHLSPLHPPSQLCVLSLLIAAQEEGASSHLSPGKRSDTCLIRLIKGLRRDIFLMFINIYGGREQKQSGIFRSSSE